MGLFLVVAGCSGVTVGGDDVDETSAAVTSRKGIDYSFARPSVSSLHAQGYT